MPSGTVIQKALEQEFDLPFSVEVEGGNEEPRFLVRPTNTGNQLFSVAIGFRNSLRMVMEFLPEDHSANFIRAMGKQPEQKRRQFVLFARALEEKGARCLFRANRHELDLLNPDTWPEEWVSFEARATKMPVDIPKGSDYSSVAAEWSLLMVGLVLSLADIVQVQDDEEATTPGIIGRPEGGVQTVLSNRYERSPFNRRLCLASRGYACAVCGMDFEQRYGPIGRGFIHVHHIVPVSQLGPSYEINPSTDLIPVCPNCHAMLHRRNPPFSPGELRELLKTQLGSPPSSQEHTDSG